MLDQTTVIPYSIESLNDTLGSSERAEVSQSTESISEGKQKDLKQEKTSFFSYCPLKRLCTKS